MTFFLKTNACAVGKLFGGGGRPKNSGTLTFGTCIEQVVLALNR